jgi:outer membrane protein TolC
MNKIRIVFLLIAGFFCCPSIAQKKYSLEEIVEMAKGQSPFSKQAETRKENRYWSYRFYKSNYNPQLRLSGVFPTYTKSNTQTPVADGSYRYNLVENTNNDISLGLVQPLPFSGGTVSVNTGLNYNKNYLADSTDIAEQWGGTVVNFRLTQPLFGFNQLKWDKRTEPLRFEESKRSYVEELENISKEVSTRFFNVLDAQINLQIALFNQANNDTISKIENGRYNIGTTTKDKFLEAELQLLRSRQDVTQAKINSQIAVLDLRSYLGIKEDETFELLLPETLPALVLSVEQALQYAKENRADYIAFERRKFEADREVAQAKGQRFEGTNVSAAFGLNNNGFVVSDIYQDPQPQRTFALTLDMPVVDWGRNKARVRTAMANKKLNDYIIAQDEVNFEQQIITQVSQFEVLLSQIEITKKSDEIAQERYMVSQNRYLVGKIDVTDLNIALTQKDTAKRSYINALRAFWTAYYDLRRLTLYDFANGRLLYDPNLK